MTARPTVTGTQPDILGSDRRRTDGEATYIGHPMNISLKRRNDNIIMASLPTVSNTHWHPTRSPWPRTSRNTTRGLDRIVNSAALLLSLGLVLSAVGCSHKTPYYRADQISTIDLPQLEVPELSQRLILIGDAWKPLEGEPVLATLSEWAALAPERTTVVFLGDNIYEVGMPDAAAPNRAKAERSLLAQIGPVATSGARGLFIPGNHDWGGGGTQGLAGILRQQSFVDAALVTRRAFCRATGVPGRLPSISSAPGGRGQCG